MYRLISYKIIFVKGKKKKEKRFTVCFHIPFTMPLLYLFIFLVPGVKPRTLHVLGESPMSEIHSGPPLVWKDN